MTDPIECHASAQEDIETDAQLDRVESLILWIHEQVRHRSLDRTRGRLLCREVYDAWLSSQKPILTDPDRGIAQQAALEFLEEDLLQDLRIVFPEYLFHAVEVSVTETQIRVERFPHHGLSEFEKLVLEHCFLVDYGRPCKNVRPAGCQLICCWERKKRGQGQPAEDQKWMYDKLLQYAEQSDDCQLRSRLEQLRERNKEALLELDQHLTRWLPVSDAFAGLRRSRLVCVSEAVAIEIIETDPFASGAPEASSCAEVTSITPSADLVAAFLHRLIAAACGENRGRSGSCLDSIDADALPSYYYHPPKPVYVNWCNPESGGSPPWQDISLDSAVSEDLAQDRELFSYPELLRDVLDKLSADLHECLSSRQWYQPMRVAFLVRDEIARHHRWFLTTEQRRYVLYHCRTGTPPADLAKKWQDGPLDLRAMYRNAKTYWFEGSGLVYYVSDTGRPLISRDAFNPDAMRDHHIWSLPPLTLSSPMRLQEDLDCFETHFWARPVGRNDDQVAVAEMELHNDGICSLVLVFTTDASSAASISESIAGQFSIVLAEARKHIPAIAAAFKSARDTRQAAEEHGRALGWKSLAKNLSHDLKNFIPLIGSELRNALRDAPRDQANAFSLFTRTVEEYMAWLSIAGGSNLSREDSRKFTLGGIAAGIVRAFVQAYDFLDLRAQSEPEAPLRRLLRDNVYYPPVVEFYLVSGADVQSLLFATTTVTRVQGQLPYYPSPKGEYITPGAAASGIRKLREQYGSKLIVLGPGNRDAVYFDDIDWRTRLPDAAGLDFVTKSILDTHACLLIKRFHVGLLESFFNFLRYADQLALPLVRRCYLHTDDDGLVDITLANETTSSRIERESKLDLSALAEKNRRGEARSGIVGIEAFWNALDWTYADNLDDLITCLRQGNATAAFVQQLRRDKLDH